MRLIYGPWPISQVEARRLNVTGYFTGKPCFHGHIAVRDTANGQCRACKVTIRHNHWESHKDHEKATHKVWVSENREHRNALQRGWNKRHPEQSHEIARNKVAKKPELYKTIKHRSFHKIYYGDLLNSRAKGRLSSHIRRAVIKENGGSYTLQDIENIHRWQKGRCYWCKKPYGEDYHIDHIWPVSKGGENSPENLCLTCPSCNHKKNKKTPMEFAGRLF